MTEISRYDFAVIGTGPAGKRAAIEASKRGHRVVAVDREQYLGGQAVHRGTIPSKTLRESVLHVTGIAQRSF
ncbi:MAG TPA: Si-specific NAD(P)(+) transhydrogenase, partial [Chloroflexi bacterium]|nr:Si-specific NAD(P)(+) transhydrogenase [Chloroflexota bacterium]